MILDILFYISYFIFLVSFISVFFAGLLFLGYFVGCFSDFFEHFDIDYSDIFGVLLILGLISVLSMFPMMIFGSLGGVI